MITITFKLNAEKIGAVIVKDEEELKAVFDDFAEARRQGRSLFILVGENGTGIAIPREKYSDLIMTATV
jgi:hypothetical protein